MSTSIEESKQQLAGRKKKGKEVGNGSAETAPTTTTSSASMAVNEHPSKGKRDEMRRDFEWLLVHKSWLAENNPRLYRRIFLESSEDEKEDDPPQQ